MRLARDGVAYVHFLVKLGEQTFKKSKNCFVY